MQNKELYNQIEICLSESLNAVCYINELKKWSLRIMVCKAWKEFAWISCIIDLKIQWKNDWDNAGQLITQYQLLSINGRIQTIAE